VKILRNLVLISSLIAAAFLIGRAGDVQQDRRPPGQPVWEYRDGANLTMNQLNAMGAEGWELSCMTPYGKDYYYILKRVKQPVWEYRDGANLTMNQLNVMGAEGWEVSCMTPYGKDYYYILKRVKR
jgi:hypothetical protein